MRTIAAFVLGVVIGGVAAMAYLGRYEISDGGYERLYRFKRDRWTGREWQRVTFNNHPWEEVPDAPSETHAAANDPMGDPGATLKGYDILELERIAEGK